MIGTGIKRGTAELAILSVLEEGPLHGYEMARRIEEQTKGALRFTLAALYPMLYRMEQRGWIRGAWEIDRKSTRLNSSHSQISYAVFCLKKKKNKINICH